jgi:hypothetical protein
MERRIADAKSGVFGQARVEVEEGLSFLQIAITSSRYEPLPRGGAAEGVAHSQAAPIQTLNLGYLSHATHSINRHKPPKKTEEEEEEEEEGRKEGRKEGPYAFKSLSFAVGLSVCRSVCLCQKP